MQINSALLLQLNSSERDLLFCDPQVRDVLPPLEVCAQGCCIHHGLHFLESLVTVESRLPSHKTICEREGGLGVLGRAPSGNFRAQSLGL